MDPIKLEVFFWMSPYMGSKTLLETFLSGAGHSITRIKISESTRGLHGVTLIKNLRVVQEEMGTAHYMQLIFVDSEWSF